MKTSIRHLCCSTDKNPIHERYRITDLRGEIDTFCARYLGDVSFVTFRAMLLELERPWSGRHGRVTQIVAIPRCGNRSLDDLKRRSCEANIAAVGANRMLTTGGTFGGKSVIYLITGAIRPIRPYRIRWLIHGRR